MAHKACARGTSTDERTGCKKRNVREEVGEWVDGGASKSVGK